MLLACSYDEIKQIFLDKNIMNMAIYDSVIAESYYKHIQDSRLVIGKEDNHEADNEN